jgi:hypothetical protein
MRHSPAPQLPQGWKGLPSSQVRGGVAVAVAVAVAVGVSVNGGAHPEAVQASQQLANCPTQAVPPGGAMHFATLLFVLHFVLPVLVVRQQVTKPGLPQIERAAHFFTKRAQDGFASVKSACCAAQLTYAPWLGAVAQSQFCATAARALAMSLLSGSTLGSQLA